MFTVRELHLGNSVLQYRKEQLTGLRCRISPDRTKRGLDVPYSYSPDRNGCPFCPDQVFSVTPEFPGGERIRIGESITFPNLYPFASYHTVTVITSEHIVDNFSKKQLSDAFIAQVCSLSKAGGYPSINWNYLPSAGASLAHPHLQGLADEQPPVVAGMYMNKGERYLERHGRCYWDAWRDHEEGSERYLFGDEICWTAHAVPLGEREVRGVLPVATLEDSETYLDTLIEGILSVISLYRDLGTHAFNLSLFFDKCGSERGYRAFCSIISRINPNTRSLADSSFMERLHLEPVILTLPEDLGAWYRKNQ
jgi:UDPglucose--hexose-1-phosphate uridylyltransferase